MLSEISIIKKQKYEFKNYYFLFNTRIKKNNWQVENEKQNKENIIKKSTIKFQITKSLSKCFGIIFQTMSLRKLLFFFFKFNFNNCLMTFLIFLISEGINMFQINKLHKNSLSSKEKKNSFWLNTNNVNSLSSTRELNMGFGIHLNFFIHSFLIISVFLMLGWKIIYHAFFFIMWDHPKICFLEKN